jgi:hypothetical protein
LLLVSLLLLVPPPPPPPEKDISLLLPDILPVVLFAEEFAEDESVALKAMA